jgi:hypothetical protein
MKKPENMWKFFGVLLLIFGAVFLFSGALSLLGILHTDPASQGDPRLWFPILGGVFLAFGVILCAVSYQSEKAHKLLFAEGLQTKARVTSVKQLLFMKWGGLSPYVVSFTYEIEGIQYTGKSNLLWSQPKVYEQMTVTVFIDSEKPAHCAVDL